MQDQDKTKEQLLADIASLKESLTGQQHQIEQLRQSEEKYLNLFRDSAIGMVVVMTDGRIAQSNKSFCDFLGYSEEELLGKAIVSITHPDDREASSQAVCQTFSSGARIRRFEKRYLHKSGRVLWGEVSATVISDAEGKPSYSIAQVWDINERKQAEEALRASEAKYRRLYQSMMDAFASVNMAGFIQEFNEPYRQMLGYEPEEMVKLHYTDITPEKWHSLQAEIIEKQVLTRGYSEMYEKEYRRKDGTIFPVELRNCLIKDEMGQPVGIWAIVRDITERKQAEEALRKAQEELELRVEERTAELVKVNKELAIHRLFAEAATQGFGIADLNGYIRYLNPAMCRIMGEERIEDVLGQPFFKYGRTTEYLKEEFLPALSREGRWDKEGLVRTPRGKLVPVWHNSFLIWDDEGEPAYIATILSDITERKQAEEALRKSEVRFRSYFEQGLMGMAVSSTEMRWVQVNDRFCEIFGYSKEEVIQRKITDFVHPDDLESFHRSYHHLLSGETDHYTVDRRYLRKDGKVIYLNIFVKCFRSEGGTVDHILAVFEDVTERKQAQEALRQSHDELRLIYEQMADGIVIVDFENPHPIRANSAICRMLGYSEDELKALSPTQVHPLEVMPKIREHFEAVAQGKVARFEDMPFLRRDGNVIYADVVSSRIFYNGRFCRISFLHDVTERKQAEEALQREHRTLKHLLQSSDHERQTIAYEIHDGLAQYLAAAIMQFDVYRNLLGKPLNDATKVYEMAISLLRQGHFAARRLIAGVRHPVLDESGVVEAIAHLINEQNREKGPQIEFNSKVKFSRLVPILENAIYRICQEGLSNACKHSESEKVWVSLLQQNDRIRIEIRDWGIGFNPKNVKEGSYGLIGIRERARLLGGKYRLQSAAGKGTRIVVELPLMEREE